METTTTKVICGICGHGEELTGTFTDEVYFPNRYVRYVNGSAIACTACRRNHDMVIFGRNYVSGLSDFPRVAQLPHVIESNQVYRDAKDAQAVIRKKEDSVRTWIRSYERTQRTQKNYKARLKELQTWDTSNNNPDEREAKVEALTRLIK